MHNFNIQLFASKRDEPIDNPRYRQNSPGPTERKRVGKLRKIKF